MGIDDDANTNCLVFFNSPNFAKTTFMPGITTKLEPLLRQPSTRGPRRFFIIKIMANRFGPNPK